MKTLKLEVVDLVSSLKKTKFANFISFKISSISKMFNNFKIVCYIFFIIFLKTPPAPNFVTNFLDLNRTEKCLFYEGSMSRNIVLPTFLTVTNSNVNPA